MEKRFRSYVSFLPDDEEDKKDGSGRQHTRVSMTSPTSSVMAGEGRTATTKTSRPSVTAQKRASVASSFRTHSGQEISVYDMDEKACEFVMATFGVFLIKAYTEVLGPIQVWLYIWYIRCCSPSGYLYASFNELGEADFNRFSLFTIVVVVAMIITSAVTGLVVHPYLPVQVRRIVSRLVAQESLYSAMMGALIISPVYPVMLLTPHNQFPLDLGVTGTSSD
ncbi:unnamed protein product [Vitrella brassicaformis CCMP3155]|uniref:Uncharacterized protein n=2 Tax=Vitrella brassicaformis TaxID=1169539 RepID=A0A0G4ERQ4_VITBC|nr:unnamed protein product [Vitrella brassicaformis CCMP3155]|mmetsp:Transcript_34881/g.86563  ORF Transcript_34881/g.86563 Transcript_34881/m.86563 type:complete len:222 (+) Transcript_34881:521-1186(+)|eukprot:CEM00562.1 unnamed protein product [Vitrella brassicaformis CCMP3155]